jgi:hypothetical protein
MEQTASSTITTAYLHFEEKDGTNQSEIMSLFARILSLKKELAGSLKWHQWALSLIHELLEKLCMKKHKVGSTLLDCKNKSLHAVNGFHLRTVSSAFSKLCRSKRSLTSPMWV